MTHGGWWRTGSWGYTTDIAGAGEYDFTAAAEIVARANIGCPADAPNEARVPVRVAHALVTSEREWRTLLWTAHGCPTAALYGDDGEMSCGSCGVDFLRMTPAQIALRGLEFMQATLQGGITAVRDCGGKDYIEFAVRDACNAGRFSGPTMRCAVVQSGPDVTSPRFSIAIRPRVTIVAFAEAAGRRVSILAFPSP